MASRVELSQNTVNDVGMMPYESVLEALRPLRLPIERGRERAVESAVESTLRSDHESSQQAIERAAYMADLWLEGEQHRDLRPLVNAAITAGMPTTGGETLAARYPALLRKLETDLQSRDLAAALISEAPLIYRLSADQGMSATQIAHVLSQVLGGTFFPYESVESVMTALGQKAALDSDRVSQLSVIDYLAASKRFADASYGEATDIAGAAALRLGFDGDLGAMLRDLCPPALPSRANIPYLQALEFVCFVAAEADHPPQFLYEFAPRGQVANQIFARYSNALAPTGNPILNNFKAVEAADRAWARSRPSMASNALVRLLEGLAKLPYGARRDLAAWLRQWLLHTTSLLDPGPREVFDLESVLATHIERLLSWVCSGNTQTAGTAEQRTVDALASLLHPARDGWRGRGFGDAVNISNLSRRKLGDCEFQLTSNNQVVGYEPHGGRLTLPYLEGHLKSARRVIDLRVEEWSTVSDPSRWSVEVQFVAHEIDPMFVGINETTNSGVLVTVGAETFSSFVTRSKLASHPDSITSAVTTYVFAALNRPQTPQRIRDIIAERTGLALIPQTLEAI